MTKAATYGDKVDYLQLGMNATYIGVCADLPPRDLARQKQAMLADIRTDVIDGTINPALATLRRSIIGAYDPKSDTLPAQAVTTAIQTAVDAMIPQLKGEMEDKQQAATTLACIETVAVFNTKIPTKTQDRSS